MSHLRQVRNYKRIVAPITYMVSSEDDVIDVDTTSGLATIYIPNIQADATIDRKIYINDVSNNAGTNPITIVTIGGNTINNVTSLPLSVNGISAEILIIDRNRYLANLNSDDTSGGTLTGANNGLNVVANTVKLGGSLLQPTIITASSVNHLDIQDGWGSFMKTRDANANFSIADFGGNNFIGTNSYIFSYLATQNTYTDTFIVLNFGSVNNFLNAVDTFNFGDYGTFSLSNVTFNLGRSNQYLSTYSSSVFGNFNSVLGVSTTKVFGDYNFINTNNAYVLGTSVNLVGGGYDAYVVGTNISFTGSGGYLFGHQMNIDGTAPWYGTGNIFAFGFDFDVVGGANVDAIVSIGFNNTINATSSTRGVYMFGDTHICNDFVTYSTLIGESCNYTRVDHSTSVGIFNTLTDATYVYNLGEGNSFNNSINIVSLGNYNNISASTNLSVFGSNNTIGDSDKLYIGNNNQNIVIDSLTGFVGIGTVSPVVRLQVVGGSGQAIYATSTNDITVNAVGSGASSYGIKGESDFGTAIRGNITDTSGVGLDINYTPTNTTLFKVLGNGDVCIGTPAPLARFHNFGVNASGINQRLEPITGVTEDTTGNTASVVGAGTTTIETLAVDTDKVVTITSKINCRKTGGGGAGSVGDGCGYIITATFKNVAGVVSQIGVTDNDHTAEDLPLNSVSYLISGTSVLVQGVNADANNLDWTSISKIKK